MIAMIQKKKQQQLKMAEQQEKLIEAEESKNGKWTFAKSAPVIAKKEVKKPQPTAPINIGKSNNVFERLEGVK